MQKSILIVDDETDMLFVLGEAFESDGFVVYKADNGADALEMFKENKPDIVISDVLMPKMNGVDLVKSIRELDQTVPVLLLTSKVAVSDAVTGLSAGANDYIRKPFSIVEVIARANSFINYLKADRPAELKFGKFVYDPVPRTLTIEGQSETLTNKEGALIEIFARNLNRMVPTDEILSAIWKSPDIFSTRSLHVYVARIKKLIAPDPRLKIINDRSTGYRMVLLEEP